MTREQAINYLISSGFTQEQVCEVVRALTYAPTTKNNLGVDCISRADAIRAIQDKAKKLTNEDTINGLCGAVAILFELPSVTPQPRWIPVEEKLPEEQGLYLVTIKSGDKYYIDTDLYNTLYKKGFRTPNVIAWMPLPQAYKEVEE